MKWLDGRIYEGPWINDKQDGIGFYTNVSGLRRKGKW